MKSALFFVLSASLALPLTALAKASVECNLDEECRLAKLDSASIHVSLEQGNNYQCTIKAINEEDKVSGWIKAGGYYKLKGTPIAYRGDYKGVTKKVEGGFDTSKGNKGTIDITNISPYEGVVQCNVLNK